MNRDRQEGALLPPLRHRLSAKVLALAVVFILLGDLLGFLQSITDFRVHWLKAKMAEAEIAALAAEAAPDQLLSSDLRSEVFKVAGIQVVALTRDNTRRLLLRSDEQGVVEETFDLRDVGWLASVRDAVAALVHPDARVVGLIDRPETIRGETIEVALDESPMRLAMIRHSVSAIIISLVMSVTVAVLLFYALNAVLMRPMQRLTRKVVAFGKNPEDASTIIMPSGRRDEFGMAEAGLHHMQRELVSLLQHRNRLAALGLAVTKVSHEMRNMLSTAQLISDRLAASVDPAVKRSAPKLIESLDRAIVYLDQTLRYGRAQEPPPQREVFGLRPLADDVIAAAVQQASPRITFYNHVPKDVTADADRDQLGRVLGNLLRNAGEALHQSLFADPGRADGSVTLRAWREGSVVLIEVTDNGPGIPGKVLPKLFEPFQSAAKAGGTGLGLAIAAELLKAHGGTIRLSESGPDGTRFTITLPDRVIGLKAGRRGALPLDRSA